jgi:dolichol-phosphate mannosyltransferase
MAGRAELLVGVPTYNEAGNVDTLAADLLALPASPDVLFIDDASPDGTGAVLDRLARGSDRLRVLHRPGRLGIGSAHQAAIGWAYDRGYRRLVTMDGDLTHPPSQIGRLMEAAGGFDLVVGSRYVQPGSMPGWSGFRRSQTIVAHGLTTRLLGLDHDATSSFRCYRLDRIPRERFEGIWSTGYSFFLESLCLLQWRGVRIGDVPVVLPPRRAGSSKMTVLDAAVSARTLLRLTAARLARHGAGLRR